MNNSFFQNPNINIADKYGLSMQLNLFQIIPSFFKIKY